PPSHIPEWTTTGWAGAGGSTTGGAPTGLRDGSGGGAVDFFEDAGKYDRPVVVAATPPPPISGGTLAVIAGGKWAAAADSDRDQVVIGDLERVQILATIALKKADEPGRLVEDGAGRLHVALRGAGAVATLDVTTGTELSCTAVCNHPRGLAYESATDVIHVA